MPMMSWTIRSACMSAWTWLLSNEGEKGALRERVASMKRVRWKFVKVAADRMLCLREATAVFTFKMRKNNFTHLQRIYSVETHTKPCVLTYLETSTIPPSPQ